MVKIIAGNCYDELEKLDSESVDCCVTSPPYWGLRDYDVPATLWGGKDGCDHDWVDHGTSKKSGGKKGKVSYRTGDSAAAFTVRLGKTCSKCEAFYGCLGHEPDPFTYARNLSLVMDRVRRVLKPTGTLWLNVGDTYCGSGRGGGSGKQKTNVGSTGIGSYKVPEGMKPKDLAGVPFLVAFALRDQGWWFRSPVVWHKRNAMPENVKDRPAKSYEFMFMFTKSLSYYSDEDRMPYTRDFWEINNKSYKKGHYATFPVELVKKCLLLSCPHHGNVLDPFAGSGTVGQAANDLNNDSILMEIKEDYIPLIKERSGQPALPF